MLWARAYADDGHMVAATRKFSGDRKSWREVPANVSAEEQYIERLVRPWLLFGHGGIGSTVYARPPRRVPATGTASREGDTVRVGKAATNQNIGMPAPARYSAAAGWGFRHAVRMMDSVSDLLTIPVAVMVQHSTTG